MAMERYPLSWPQGWRRTPANERKNGTFNKKEYQSGLSYKSSKWLTVSDGVTRVLESLQKMGVSRDDVIISTNVRTRLDGLPRSSESEPADPGACAYWRDSFEAPPRCMAIDQYTTVADNLAAIAATLEAMRAIERHGGATVMNRAFMGFNALPSQTDGENWWTILGCEPNASVDRIDAAYKAKLREVHPDRPGGSHEAMVKVNLARDQALSVDRS